MTPDFDTIEIRSCRTLAEAEYYWRHRLKKIPAARIDIVPAGILPRLRRLMDAISLRGGLR